MGVVPAAWPDGAGVRALPHPLPPAANGRGVARRLILLTQAIKAECHRQKSVHPGSHPGNRPEPILGMGLS